MILTFGGKKGLNKDGKVAGQNSQLTNGDYVSEELRDEQVNAKLIKAFNLKNEMKNDDAIQLYLDVLSQDFLKESKVDKHVYMRFNAYKNLGELQERIGEFKDAKLQYTDVIIPSLSKISSVQALKIKEKDPFIWTRLGFLEYEQFRDYQLSRKCFEAAIQTYTSTEKRSSKINPILVKLAEIHFQSYDFKRSEEMVDAILQRHNERDPNPSVFAMILKSFFLSLRNDSQTQFYLQKAATIKPNCSYQDLHIIKAFFKSMSDNLMKKDLVLSNKALDGSYSYQAIKIQNCQEVISVSPLQQYQSFMYYFDDFLLSVSVQCEKAVQFSNLHKTRLDCSNFIPAIQSLLQQIQQDSQSVVLSISAYQEQLSLYETQLNNAPQQSNQVTQMGKKQEQVDPSKRFLRRKLDQTEQQLKQFNIKALRQLKDIVMNALEDENENKKFLMYSHYEIINGKQFFMEAQTVRNVDELNSQDLSQQVIVKSVEQANNVLGEHIRFFEALTKIDTKGMQFILRNMIRFLLDTLKTPFINFNNASSLYRWFLLLINSNLTHQNLESVGSFNAILTFFELSLFNTQVIKQVKSNAIMIQREMFFSYFQYKEQEIQLDFVRKIKQEPEQADIIEQVRIRFYYTMMYYSFEIKNDMSSSIRYYEKLDTEYLKRQGRILLPWISQSQMLDEQKVVQYGSCKIKEAQVVKDFDENLIQLKLIEVREIDEAKKLNQMVSKQFQRNRAEFTKFAGFYFDQLCFYLQKAYQSEASFNASFSTNEEKIKEMWNKLLYSLCRCQSSVFFKITNNLFSVLTAFQFLQKSFFEQFILKKLEFEPIITEIQERLKAVFNQMIYNVKTQDDNLTKARLFVHDSMAIELDSDSPFHLLKKLEINLLRLFNQEFIFFQIVQNLKQGENSQLLMFNYFQSLFFIETFTAFLNTKEENCSDLDTVLTPVIILMKKLDKLVMKNNEFFYKPYIKLIAIVYPSIIALLTPIFHNKGLVTSTNLFQMVMQMSYYFFDLKFKISKDLNQVEVDNYDESEIEDKKCYSLDCLMVIKERSHKIWTSVMGGNLQNASGQQNKNMTPNLNNVNIGQTNPQLVYLYNSGAIDFYFLNNLIMMTNNLSDDRLFQYGEVTQNDLSNLSSLIDTLAKYFLEHAFKLKEKCPMFKEHGTLFKKHFKGDPLEFLTQLQLLNMNKSTCDCNQCSLHDSKKLNQSMGRLTFFILNMISHIGLESSQFQIVDIPLKKKQAIFDSISSLNAQGKLIQNLQEIAWLDVLYSEFSAESILLKSILFTELYQQVAIAKLNLGYKQNERYNSSKQHYHAAYNCLLIALQTLLKDLKNQMGSGSQIKKWRWSNLRWVTRFKVCISQILYLVLSKLQGLEFVLKSHPEIPGFNQNQKKTIKIKGLQQQAVMFAQMCEKLEKFQVIMEDPRYQDGNMQKIELTVYHLFEAFFEMVQRSSQEGKGLDKSKASMSPDLLNNYFSKITSLTEDFGNRFASIKHKVSFEYIYIQATLVKKLNKKVKEEQQNNFKHVTLLNQALEVAFINKSLNGCLECYVKLLKESLKIGIILKNEINLFMHTKLELKSILDSVNKNLLGDKQIFKYLHQKLAQVSNQKAQDSSQAAQQEAQMEDDISSSICTFHHQYNSFCIVLDEKISASLIRADIYKTSSFPEFNPYDNSIYQLYKQGDELFTILLLTRPILKLQLQMYLTKCLQFEYEVNPISENYQEIHVIEKLRDMIAAVQGSMLEEQQNISSSNYSSDDNKKNMVSMLNQSQVSTTELRIKTKIYFIQLNEKSKKHESVNEIFRTCLKHQQILDKRERDTGVVQQKSVEMEILLKESKDKYIQTLFHFCTRQMDLYLNLRKVLKSGSGNQEKNTDLELAKKVYKDFRQQNQVKKDHIPGILRDIFEIFVDSHMKKSFLNSRNLIDDNQKRMIRQCVLKCSAFCGPDSELESQGISAKFLDLNQISIAEYECEGTLICIQWFLNILEERQNKKDADFHKKLKITSDEIKDMIKKEQSRLNSSFNVQQQPTGFENEDGQIASKVFQDE